MTAKLTTGELRRLAYEREEQRDWLTAADLWQQAADSYPERLMIHESSRDDVAKLRERALICRALGQPATLNPGEVTPKAESVKRATLFDGVVDSYQTEAELNGFRATQGALL